MSNCRRECARKLETSTSINTLVFGGAHMFSIKLNKKKKLNQKNISDVLSDTLDRFNAEQPAFLRYDANIFVECLAVNLRKKRGQIFLNLIKKMIF